jgi:hypothetical protein
MSLIEMGQWDKYNLPSGYVDFNPIDKKLYRYLRCKRSNTGKYYVITIHYKADPFKRDPAWSKNALEQQTSQKDYRREYELDWTSAAGEVYYPEFAINSSKFIRMVHYNPSLPVYRGWDFGFRHPACVWFQKVGGRCHLLHELLPSDIDTHSFRDLVRYLSGQLDYEGLERRHRAISWVKKIKETSVRYGEKEIPLPEPPWFPPTARFIDYSGPECYSAHKVESEAKERNDFQVLQSAGITLNVFTQPPSAREEVIRRLFHDGGDGHGPLMRVSPFCPILIEGFGGGIAYALPTERNPEPEEVAKDGYYEHPHDGFGYAAVNVFSVAEPQGQGSEYPAVRSEGEREQQIWEHNKPEMLDEEIFEDMSEWY